ncbi:hypothetical protein JOF53_004599 [Crossiella equi]|uniref:Uncharacterized protein n=1 Tax=Crossiella equi TaxID=130796 RepID=A0ABS5AHF6_9PSEU|nr:hypothetical protein [Crossiella equi]
MPIWLITSTCPEEVRSSRIPFPEPALSVKSESRVGPPVACCPVTAPWMVCVVSAAAIPADANGEAAERVAPQHSDFS